MNICDLDRKNLEITCKGNPQAMNFLALWSVYVHLVDDIIDEDLLEGNRERGARRVNEMGAMAIEIYTHPFFVQHTERLKQIAMNCTNAYMDSVEWESASEPWKANFSDVYRHFGAEMVLAVAHICGGYSHMRIVSNELRQVCNRENNNVPVKPETNGHSNRMQVST